MATTSTTSSLEERVTALELKRYKCPSNVKEVDESMRRARNAVESLGLYSCNWTWVPEDYYSWPLERRAAQLNAPSTSRLCKSLLLENKKVNDATYDPQFHPKFVLVVLQYDSELSTDDLTRSFRRLRPVGEGRLDPSNYNWNVADPEDNDRITGYKFNSVTPFGLLEHVPVVLSSEVAVLGYFWMGGGHGKLM
jgi:prolyl-tRNA editing enzyme YbaK/EbsC (Cys-tRNA(Pro) deacylase)